jgi:hypothetical protein
MGYIAVISSGSPCHAVMHDASRPWAVVNCEHGSGRVLSVFSRHETKKGACISAGKRVANRKREESRS